VCARSLKDILYRKRMERQLLQARGLAAGPERPPDEDDVRGPGHGLWRCWLCINPGRTK